MDKKSRIAPIDVTTKRGITTGQLGAKSDLVMMAWSSTTTLKMVNCPSGKPDMARGTGAASAKAIKTNPILLVLMISST
jgi:hypothetical protein